MKQRLQMVVCILFFMFLAISVPAQDPGPVSGVDINQFLDAAPTPPTGNDSVDDVSRTRSPDELKHDLNMAREANRFWVGVAIACTWFLSLVVVLFCVARAKHSASDVVNAAGLVLVVFGTIMLVLIADAEAQMTAGIGILGAIAGYLFGTMRSGARSQADKTPSEPDARNE